MNGRETAGLWFVVGAATVLLAASLAGSGTGFFGGGYMLHMAWAYVVVLGGLAVVLFLLRPKREAPELVQAPAPKGAK